MALTLNEESTPAAVAGAVRLFTDTSNRPACLDENGTVALIARSQVVRKTAQTQVVNASTALVNDDALLFAIAASENWAGTITLFVDTNVAAGIKVAATVPAGATLRLGVELFTAAAAGAIDTTTSSGTAIGTTAAITKVNVQLLVLNSTNAGNVQLQWAQNASNGSDTKVLTNSFMRVEKF